jgi:O-antigen biosynthesis protein WbqP
MIKRIFDLFFLVNILFLVSVPLILIFFIIKFNSSDPVLYWSKRVGRHNKIFMMPKFRTMKCDTPDVASHLLKNPTSQITPLGSFLRKFSIDEWPQLWSIFLGDMSFVGPRPALFNQHDLIKLRNSCGVHEILPGLTGLAQIKGRDMLNIAQKVEFDVIYLNNKTIWLDIKILFLTFLSVFNTSNISH